MRQLTSAELLVVLEPLNDVLEMIEAVQNPSDLGISDFILMSKRLSVVREWIQLQADHLAAREIVTMSNEAKGTDPA